MGKRGQYLSNIFKITFMLAFLSVVVFFCWGEIFMPREYPTGEEKVILYDAVWERVYADGTRYTVEIPGKTDAKPGEIVRVETSLPNDQKSTWLCMRASQQEMRIFVGDELRKIYSTEETRFFGNNSASAYVFFEITQEDAGEVLAIELISHNEYAGFLNEIYIGEKGDIIFTFIKECSLVLMVSFYMLVLSSVTVFIGMILRFVYKKHVDIVYLGLGIMLLSMAMIAESRVRQFFLANSSIAEHVGFLLTILIPFPFIVYLNRVQKGRYRKVHSALAICVMINFFFSLLLQVFNIVSLLESSLIAYILIIIMVICFSGTIAMDFFMGRIREYGEIIYGLIVMILVTIWEIYVFFVPDIYLYGGFVLSFGLIVLLFMAAVKTTKDLISVEQERQMAIAAGAAKARFLANMSHEIRTPINTIIGMNEMILRENRDAAIDEYALHVQNAGKLLLGLVNDVLDFSKIEAGKLDILESDYQLRGMLSDVIRGVQVRAENKKLDIVTNIDKELPSILRGDEIRIRQILNNLLSNAVKYTKRGKVTFSVKGIYCQDTFALQMSIEDTGIGIKQEDIGKLFDSFKRLEESKNQYIEGTGLGLNITRQLVELMHGTIEVESEYGKGSCFTVTIPQVVVDSTIMGAIQETRHNDRHVKKEYKPKLYAPTAEVLVVDDNEMNLLVIRSLLKRTAIKLTMAHGGRECLEKCQNKKFDLILMDHMMPELNGIDTMHMIRKEEGPNQSTEIIVLTANALVGMAEMYIKEGFSDYLSKPVMAEELEKMLRIHLPSEKLEL